MFIIFWCGVWMVQKETMATEEVVLLSNAKGGHDTWRSPSFKLIWINKLGIWIQMCTNYSDVVVGWYKRTCINKLYLYINYEIMPKKIAMFILFYFTGIYLLFYFHIVFFLNFKQKIFCCSIWIWCFFFLFVFAC